MLNGRSVTRVGWLTITLRADPKERILTVRLGEECRSRDRINVDQTTTTKGEVRLRFRRKSNGERYVFHAEAIYDNVAGGTGFTGFKVKGEVRVKENAVRRTAYTVLYNVHEWGGWS